MCRSPLTARTASYSYTSVKLVVGGGFEPPKSYDDRFTVCSLWPLGNPSTLSCKRCWLARFSVWRGLVRLCFRCPAAPFGFRFREAFVSSKDVFTAFFPLVGDLPYEEFWIAALNRSNKIIHKQKISQGGVSETVVDVKVVLKVALEKLASGLLLCHNHPSGSTSPSSADDKITWDIYRAAHCCGIRVLDHIIISGTRFYSYSDEGRLEGPI